MVYRRNGLQRKFATVCSLPGHVTTCWDERSVCRCETHVTNYSRDDPTNDSRDGTCGDLQIPSQNRLGRGTAIGLVCEHGGAISDSAWKLELYLPSSPNRPATPTTEHTAVPPSQRHWVRVTSAAWCCSAHINGCSMDESPATKRGPCRRSSHAAPYAQVTKLLQNSNFQRHSLCRIRVDKWLGGQGC